MKTDRELLELAAKAYGRIIGEATDPIGRKYVDSLGLWCEGPCDGWFNPLEDDGDALRMAVKLKMLVNVKKESSMVKTIDVGLFSELHKGDASAATRRAIVRAAAVIQLSKEKA
jgi:hypothetical protein